MLKILKDKNIECIGHAGCSYSIPNSSASIMDAINAGCKMIEVDIQRNNEGFICNHDAFIDGKLSTGMSNKDCKKKGILLLGELSEIANEYRDVVFLFDCKFSIQYTDSFYKVASILFKNYIIGSFYEHHLTYHHYNKALITSSIPLDYFDQQIKKLRVNTIILYHNNIHRQLVDYLHRRGITVYIHTVDDIVLCEYLCEMGIDGIITNIP